MNDPHGLPPALPPDRLRWTCDPSQFTFELTSDLDVSDDRLAQSRAENSINFGIGMKGEGYNLYAMGPPGIGKRSLATLLVERHAAEQPVPSDWCYVHNFDESEKPRAIKLPAGLGKELKSDMASLIDDLRSAVPAALESEQLQAQKEELQQEIEEKHDQSLRELAEKAFDFGLQVIRTPVGVALAPVRDGEVIGPEEFDQLSDEEKRKIQESIKILQPDLQAIVEQLPALKRKASEEIKSLQRESIRFVIGDLFRQRREKYQEYPDVIEYLNAVEGDVVQNARDFQAKGEEENDLLAARLIPQPSFRQYEVNLFLDNGDLKGAPVVYEGNPHYHNILGRVEYRSHMGSLVTDFMLIRAGALHRANGGYLLLPIRSLLMQPFVWEGLKHAIKSRRIRIDSPGESLGLVSTIALEPEPIPLDVKIVLLGDRMLYYLLRAYDPDFEELFKVAADFEDQMERTEDDCRVYAQLIAALAKREQTPPLDAGGVAAVIEHAARVCGDSERLSTHLRGAADLIRESGFWAATAHAGVISASHVETAVEQQIHRLDRLPKRLQEQITRDNVLIDTDGAHVGQLNGLSVIQLGDLAFGRPSRITATARLGKGEVIDIEREVELGGSIHSKGVLILSSFLAARYAGDRPLSLSASLVFEQSYGMVDGDSASCAELCCLLSALAEIPLKQNLAITGSINQHGQAQPIGAVNEKIEGFFDVCRARKLSGDQGVLIPCSNVKNLMLRKDVVQACRNGEFHIYEYKTIDQAIELLTGMPAGERDASGNFVGGSFNERVQKRLNALSELRRQFSAEHGKQADKG